MPIKKGPPSSSADTKHTGKGPAYQSATQRHQRAKQAERQERYKSYFENRDRRNATARARRTSWADELLRPWVSERESRLDQSIRKLAQREAGQPGLVQSMSRGVQVTTPNLEVLWCSPFDAYGGWSDDKKIAMASESYLATWGTTPPVTFADAVAQRDPCLPRHVDELVRGFPPYTPDDLAAKAAIEAVQRDAQQMTSGTYVPMAQAASGSGKFFELDRVNTNEGKAFDLDRMNADDGKPFDLDKPSETAMAPAAQAAPADFRKAFAAASDLMRLRIEALAAGTVYDPKARPASTSSGGMAIALLALAYFGGLFK